MFSKKYSTRFFIPHFALKRRGVGSILAQKEIERSLILPAFCQLDIQIAPSSSGF
jgi:hypothetical protein